MAIQQAGPLPGAFPLCLCANSAPEQALRPARHPACTRGLHRCGAHLPLLPRGLGASDGELTCSRQSAVVKPYVHFGNGKTPGRFRNAKLQGRSGDLRATRQFYLCAQRMIHSSPSEQAKEVSDALDWCQDYVGLYGGDPDRIAVVAHSAGAHLAALVLLCRASVAAAAAAAAAGSSDVGSRSADGEEASAASAAAAAAWREPLGISSTRLPALFIGLAGVYDVAKASLQWHQRLVLGALPSRTV